MELQKRLLMLEVRDLTPEEALALFDQEILRTEKSINDREQAIRDWHGRMLGNVAEADRRVRELWILKLCDEELLRCLKNSRSRLIEEMTKLLKCS